MTACHTQADRVPERPPDFRDNRTPLTATSLHDEKAAALAEILAVASASSLTTIYVSHSSSAFLSATVLSGKLFVIQKTGAPLNSVRPKTTMMIAAVEWVKRLSGSPISGKTDSVIQFFGF
jgi:hypothetical protein